jgi:molybdopterin-guanine dinucleotide biosynthesis protein A
MNLSVMILAGGQSSRMGQDKALLPIGGGSCLQCICEIGLQCAPDVYVATSWPDRYAPIVPAGCHLIQEIGSPRQPQGPLVGFAQGLMHVKTDWVLLLACDLPNLQFTVLQDWIDGLATVSSEAIALLPRHKKGWEPLCGFYRRSCLSSLQTFIQQGGRSFQQWLMQQTVQELPVSDRTLLFNCNTPEDWQRAIELRQRIS